jgi:Fe-S oxidoreductase
MLEHIRELGLKKTNELVTFHDACQLSRLEDKEMVPRKIIKKLFTLLEMEPNKRDTLCCGGMRAGHKPPGLIELREKRLRQAVETGAPIMLTECVTCYEKYAPLAGHIGVKDLTEVVFDNLNK